MLNRSYARVQRAAALAPNRTLIKPRAALSRGDVLRVLAVNLLWALCYPLISIGLAAAPPLYFGGLRALIAGAVLLAAGIAARRPLPTSVGTWVALALVGVTTTSLGFGGMFMAGDRISPGLATVISNSQPLLAAMLGAVVLSEPLRGRALLAIGIGFGGVALVAVPGFESAWTGNIGTGALLVLLAAVGVAAGNILLKRLAGRVDPWMAMGIQLLIGAGPLFVASGWLDVGTAVVWTPSFLTALVVLAVLGTALAFQMWFRLMERNPLNRLNTFTFLTPVFALVIGTVLFAERPTFVQWLGIVVVLSAAVLAGTAPSAGTQRAG